MINYEHTVSEHNADIAALLSVLRLSEKGGSSERRIPLIVFENTAEVTAFSKLETQPISITLTEDAVAVVGNNNEG